MDPTASHRNIIQAHHVNHIEIDNIEYFERFVIRNAAKQRAITIIAHIIYVSLKIKLKKMNFNFKLQRIRNNNLNACESV